MVTAGLKHTLTSLGHQFVNKAANAHFKVGSGLETGPIEVKSAKAHVEGVDIEVVDTPALESENAERAIIRYLQRRKWVSSHSWRPISVDSSVAGRMLSSWG